MKLLKEMKKYFEEDLDRVSVNSKFKDLDDKDIDNDGDADDTDSYLHNKLSNVAKNVDEDLDEGNVTGNLDGGEGPPKTPYAFGKEEDEMDNAEQFGYKKVKQESTFMKMSRLMNEVSYRDYKNYKGDKLGAGSFVAGFTPADYEKRFVFEKK